MMSVSVYIITKNEEARIGRAVKSVVSWADEVIVVDSGSTDATVKRAEQAGARVLYRDWEGYGPQKRFAEEQCRNDWVLNIDADEEVTPELAKQIVAAVGSAPTDIAAFRIRVTDMLPGESRPKWFAYYYNIPRLYNRRRAAMSTHRYQDRIEIRAGRIGQLKGRILHRSFVSWEATVSKLNFYSSQVANAATDARRGSRVRIWVEFPMTFLRIWILRRYFLRGTTGFAVSITVAYLNLLRLLKIREKFSAASAREIAESDRRAA